MKKSDLKVAQVVCVYPPYKGGIGNVAYQFKRILSDYFDDITIITPQYADEDAQEGVKRLRPFLKYGNGAFLPCLFKEVLKYDIIHLHYPFFGAAEVVCLAKLLFKKRFKLIVHYHMDVVGLSWIAKILSFPSCITKSLLFCLADQVTCASIDYVQNSDVRKIFKKYHKKFNEIPFGVDLDFFKPAKIENKEKRALFVGGLDKAHYFKGLNILLKAFSLCKTGELVIVGDGDMREQYQKQALKLGIQDRVKFVGGVDNEELAELYRSSLFLVLPSMNKCEAFGLVLLEAMASGTALVASNLPGVRSVFRDRVQGFLVEPGSVADLADKIKIFFSNFDKAVKMGETGRSLVEEKYNWNAVGLKLQDVYLK